MADDLDNILAKRIRPTPGNILTMMALIMVGMAQGVSLTYLPILLWPACIIAGTVCPTLAWVMGRLIGKTPDKPAEDKPKDDADVPKDDER